MTNEDQIRQALMGLLGRAEGSFTIFEDTSTGKFVQFAGGASEPLMLDLPKDALEPDEHARAVEFFRPFGAAEQKDSFQVAFARDAAHAAGVATRVFAAVLCRPVNFPMRIQED